MGDAGTKEAVNRSHKKRTMDNRNRPKKYSTDTRPNCGAQNIFLGAPPKNFHRATVPTQKKGDADDNTRNNPDSLPLKKWTVKPPLALQDWDIEIINGTSVLAKKYKRVARQNMLEAMTVEHCQQQNFSAERQTRSPKSHMCLLTKTEAQTMANISHAVLNHYCEDLDTEDAASLFSGKDTATRQS